MPSRSDRESVPLSDLRLSNGPGTGKDRRPNAAGYFYSSNVYEGTTIPKGAARHLRVIQLDYKTYTPWRQGFVGAVRIAYLFPRPRIPARPASEFWERPQSAKKALSTSRPLRELRSCFSFLMTNIAAYKPCEASPGSCRERSEVASGATSNARTPQSKAPLFCTAHRPRLLRHHGGQRTSVTNA